MTFCYHLTQVVLKVFVITSIIHSKLATVPYTTQIVGEHAKYSHGSNVTQLVPWLVAGSSALYGTEQQMLNVEHK